MRFEIFVRMKGDSNWSPIYAAAGRGADDAAAERFARVSACLEGDANAEPNRHSSEWDSARLVREGAVVHESARGAPAKRATRPY